MKQPTKRPVKKGAILIASANFTRPSDTTAYTSGDLVANSVTAGSVVPMKLPVARVTGGIAVVNRVRLLKSDPTLTNASFRLHLYRDSPTPANGDNGAWSTTQSIYIGSVDVTVDKAFTDGARGASAGYLGFIIETVGVNYIFGLLEARAAYTPISAEVFTVTLETSSEL